MAITSIPLPPATGTITLTEDSATVTGTGTAFKTLDIGDLLITGSSIVAIGAKPTGNESATLATAFTGTTETGVAYVIIPRALSSQAAYYFQLLNLNISSQEGRLVWLWSTATEASDPGTGKVQINNAAWASATALYISDTDQSGNDQGDWLATWVGKVQLTSLDRPSVFGYATLGSVTDSTGYRSIVLSDLVGTPAFNANERIAVALMPAGLQGTAGDDAYVYIAYASNASGTDFTTTFDATLNYIAILATDTEIVSPAVGDFSGLWKQYKGVPVGHRLTMDDSVADEDTGAGTVHFDSATFGSITKMYVDAVDADALDISSLVESFDDVTNAISRGRVTLQSELDTTVKIAVDITGTVTDKTGYYEVPVSPVSGAIPADGVVLVVSFTTSGADGAGTGDVVGPASAADGDPVLFDGTTGKLLKVGAYASQGEAEAGTDNTKFMTALRTAQAIAALAPAKYPPFFIEGGECANNVTDATNDIDIAAVYCRDSTNAVNIDAGAMTKQLDADWATGTAAGFRNSASAIADATYHIYAVAKADGADADYYAHTSTDIATVLTALQAETGGADYIYACYIWSIRRVSGAIVGFVQERDWGYLKTRNDSEINTTVGTTAVLQTLAVPTGLRLMAEHSVYGFKSSSFPYIYITDPSVDDQAPVNALSTTRGNSGAGTVNDGYLTFTNTSGQVRAVAGEAGVSLRISTKGYSLPRAKLS